MLAELHDYKNQISLVMNSGIQFVDFALKIDWKDKRWRDKETGYFAKSIGEGDGPLRRLAETADGYLVDLSQPESKVQANLELSVKDSLTVLDGVWLPLPILRSMAGNFDAGPFNWARVRIVKLAQEDSDGNTHRITLAFDTKVIPRQPNIAYFAPNTEDVRAGSTFKLAHLANDIMPFLDYAWLKEWQREVFVDNAGERLKLDADAIEEDLAKNVPQAHYLNLLAVLADEVKLPAIVFESNLPDDRVKAIPVDMVLDIGNSRTCGILIEDHGQDNNGLDKRYELCIRDLTNAERSYKEPFESRVEFSQANFGKDNWSAKSGRRDAFQWTTIARIGKEASYLAGRREGNEGSTGLSSPKRYLWDQDKYDQGWRFNSTFVKNDTEPYATAEPMSGLINDLGEPLHILDENIEEEYERMSPVFTPKYSRSSLMMFMLSEVLTHALMQINSPSQRCKLEHARTPRYLRSIVMTVPPAMPKPERDIFKNSMYRAVGVVWKAFGWDKSEQAPDFSSEQARQNLWPYLPEIIVQWDEATCGQVVYLFNETQINFAGRPEEFFAAVAKQDAADKKKITVATVDIGGGTTDIVVNDYKLDYGVDARQEGSNVAIVPVQRFRDGFKVAGDDILLDIIQKQIVPALKDAIKKVGVVDYEGILSRLVGPDNPPTVQDAMLRQQLNLQIFVPLGLKIIQGFEDFDPYAMNDPSCFISGSIKELLPVTDGPTEKVLDYFNTLVRKNSANTEFNLMTDVQINVDFNKLHRQFIAAKYDICQSLQLACEVISTYQCDVLLITGRPSRLPSVQAFFKSRLPLAPGRILPMHNYKTGGWYPFHKQGRIDDPKTTASVGAMLCLLCRAGRIPNFYLRAEAIKAYSTIRFFGQIDQVNQLKNSNVYYSAIDLDNEDYEFPEQEFSVRGQLRLGFRQLNVERWSATPMYIINITGTELATSIGQHGVELKVALAVKRKRSSKYNETNENFYLKAAKRSDGKSVNKNADLQLKLNTMIDSGLGQASYWLDSGSIQK